MGHQQAQESPTLLNLKDCDLLSFHRLAVRPIQEKVAAMHCDIPGLLS